MFQSIHSILVGELKVLDLVNNEIMQLFEIHECEIVEKHNNEKEIMDAPESIDNGEKGNEPYETD
ncbi:hypothetical protein [Lederbergia citri]|uniref:Uncharacterized protein n=1 Tax=Lederbergia citri TaxID=2833580 RepID=A0A942YIP3_9BACI|nr:hypothetical protein [Lederbergia citri]MBS4196685.1 hypothetical protein [Lederbergia citri]